MFWKLASISETSSLSCNCLSVKQRMALNNKFLSFKLSKICFLKDRVFNNDKVNVSFVTEITGNGSNKLSFLNLSYSSLAENFTLMRWDYNSLMRCILSVDVILLNATYIWPGLNYFWRCKSNLTTPSLNSDLVPYESYMHMTVLMGTTLF